MTRTIRAAPLAQPPLPVKGSRRRPCAFGTGNADGTTGAGEPLGSVLARTDQAGSVVARFDYQPFGEQSVTPDVQGDRQYNGRVYDAGTGFHDYGARMYWPQIGRFISADTYAGDIKDPASLNRYSYVWNNPYKYVDPDGHTSAIPSIYDKEHPGPVPLLAAWLAQRMAAASLDESLPIEVRASAAVVGTVASLLDPETVEKTGVAMGVAGSIKVVGELTPAQAANLARFEKKLPAGAGETTIHELPGGGKAFQAEVPGKVPGSKAIYEKQVDSSGKTQQVTKTTVDPKGEIVHVKDKINGTVIKP